MMNVVFSYFVIEINFSLTKIQTKLYQNETM